ncbi:MAG TPA: DUF4198 domain-containing protein [Gemmatimonadaceae bacterium]
MSRRARTIAVSLIMLVGVAGTLRAHDFFFRLDDFFVAPQSTIKIRALNGTFSSSENSITRDRLQDLSLVSSAGRDHPDTLAWSSAGDTSVLNVRAGAAGTYVAGASLKPREITLKASEFNQYLAEDGIPDVLAARRRSNELGKDATERYSKHIKAIIQVGTTRTGDFSAVLGYPAELVPLDNPYSLRSGSTIRLRAMVDGKSVANQLVVAGGRTRSGSRFKEQKVRTDASGVVRIHLAGAGQWYVKFISMVPYAGPEKLDYQSKWATVTFGVRP